MNFLGNNIAYFQLFVHHLQIVSRNIAYVISHLLDTTRHIQTLYGRTDEKIKILPHTLSRCVSHFVFRDWQFQFHCKSMTKVKEIWLEIGHMGKIETVNEENRNWKMKKMTAEREKPLKLVNLL